MAAEPVPPVEIAGRRFGREELFIIAGPCVIESPEMTLGIARRLADISARLNLPLLFKASFDKANRTSITSYRGPGLEKGLEILDGVRRETGLPVLTDVHTPAQAPLVGRVVDVLQIPAFLCRQTDLLVACGETGKPVNVKKGQFVAPHDMIRAVDKIRSTGNRHIWLTERGSSFGYNNLVVDMRSFGVMAATGCPTVMDATHSVQLPGGLGGSSGGERRFAPVLARAAVAAGADGVFLETHPDPGSALCDGPNSLPIEWVEPLLKDLQRIREIIAASSLPREPGPGL